MIHTMSSIVSGVWRIPSNDQKKKAPMWKCGDWSLLMYQQKTMADVTSAQDGLPPFVIPVNAQCSGKTVCAF